MSEKKARLLLVSLLLFIATGAAYAPGPLRGFAVLACAVVLAVVLAPRG